MTEQETKAAAEPLLDCRVRRWFREVNVGDMLIPKPLWNQTEHYKSQLTTPTKVLGISKGSSESGVLFEVRTKGGATRVLDSGWFEPPNACGEPGLTEPGKD